MIQDFEDVQAPLRYKAKICVIGAGAIGLSLVSEFLKDVANDVLIIEGGGLKASIFGDSVSDVINTGQELTGLPGSRARGFGGTSTIWGGQALPLTPSDFALRPWVENSGWPLSFKDLDPFYVRAQRILDLDERPFDADIWKPGSSFKQDFDENILSLTYSKWSPQPNLANKYVREIKSSKHVTLVVSANVTLLQLAETGNRVESVTIRSLSGRVGAVEADVFILCCGGIENTRILLNSDTVTSGGGG